MQKTETKPRESSERDYLIKKYRAEISVYPLLTRQGEKELGTKSRKGNLEARTAIINSNLRLAFKIANDYSIITGVSLMDLVQEGNMGLMEAAKRFNPEKGKFSTYASWWIKCNIKAYITERGYSIKKPAGRTDLRFDFSSLDASRNDWEEPDERNQYERTPSGEPTPAECLSKKDRIEMIRDSLKILDEREKQIAELSFGINCKDKLTARKIAEKLGITRVWVATLLNGVIYKRLKEHFEKEGYRELLEEI